MGKYSEAIGILELNVGGVVSEIKPKMGDNKVVANIVTGYQKHKDQSRMLTELGKFAFDIITREDSTLTDEDKEDLKLVIELNQMQLMEDLLVSFKWTTKEDMEKAKNQTGDMVKNLM